MEIREVVRFRGFIWGLAEDRKRFRRDSKVSRRLAGGQEGRIAGRGQQREGSAVEGGQQGSKGVSRGVGSAGVSRSCLHP